MKRSRPKKGELPKRYRCRDQYNRALDLEMSRFATQVTNDQASDSEFEATTQDVTNIQSSNTRYRIHMIEMTLS